VCLFAVDTQRCSLTASCWLTFHSLIMNGGARLVLPVKCLVPDRWATRNEICWQTRPFPPLTIRNLTSFRDVITVLIPHVFRVMTYVIVTSMRLTYWSNSSSFSILLLLRWLSRYSDWSVKSWFDSQQGQEIFFSSRNVRSAHNTTADGGVKRLGHEDERLCRD
jgi:hypothetical protein